MLLNHPFIDPALCNMEEVLNADSFHVVYLRKNSTSVFELVTQDELVAVYSGDESPYTSDIMSVSARKIDVESFEDNKITTRGLPRIKIDINMVLSESSNLDDCVDEALEYFNFNLD
jgi:hypothetical protein